MRRLHSRQRSGVVSQQRLRPRRFDSIVKRVPKLRFEPVSFLFLVCFWINSIQNSWKSENFSKMENFQIFRRVKSPFSRQVSFLSSYPITPKLFPASPQMFGDAFWYQTCHISMLTSHFKAHRRQLTTPSNIHENLEIFQKCEIFKFFVASKVHFSDEYELQNYFPCLWKCSKYVMQDQ